MVIYTIMTGISIKYGMGSSDPANVDVVVLLKVRFHSQNQLILMMFAVRSHELVPLQLGHFLGQVVNCFLLSPFR
jgi:hypothetical protein